MIYRRNILMSDPAETQRVVDSFKAADAEKTKLVRRS